MPFAGTLTDGVSSIGDYAFNGCSNLTIYGVAGSCAETFAAKKSKPFSTDPFPGT